MDMTYLTGLDYLLYKLWPFVLCAFVLGWFVGWTSCPAGEDERSE
jgi:hypothetical protein